MATPMPSRHLIETAVFDIDFSSEETAFALQSELNDFIKKELMTVVAGVFDDAARHERHWRIPCLELDLGTVTYDDYREELPRRLRQALAELLAGLRQGDGRTAQRELDGGAAQRELLAHFLLHGYLPWYARRSDAETLDQTLAGLLRAEPQWLVSLLRGSLYQERMVQRLVQQFPEALVESVIRTLAPQQAAALMALCGTLLQPGDAAAGPPPMGQEALRRRLWGALIVVLLQGQGRRGAAAAQLEAALTALMAGLPAATRAWLRQRSESGGQPLDAALATVRSRLAHADGDAPDAGASPGSPNHEAPSARPAVAPEAGHLAQRWVAAIKAGDFSLIAAQWDELVQQHGDLLLAELRRHGPPAERRRRMAQRFPEPVLAQLLAVVEPVEHGFIGALMERPQCLALPQAPVAPEGQLRRQLWEFTLAYLLLERGSRFNKKSYLGSLVRQMAVAHNLDHGELLAALTAQVAAMPQVNETVPEMLHLLTELGRELGPDAARAAAPEPQGAAYPHYQTLVAALSADDGPAAPASALSSLERDAPWLLLRLLRELQAGRFGHGLDAPGLSAALLRQLTLAFMRICHGGGADELRRAIETYAEQCVDARGYYRRVLQHLLQGELIDFEAILARDGAAVSVSQARPDTASPQTASPQTASPQTASPQTASPQTSAAVPDMDDARALSHYLGSREALSTAQAAALDQAFQRLLQQQPPTLRSLLQRAVADDHGERLAALVSEHSLSQGLALLDQAPPWRLRHYAELLTTACYALDPGIPPQRLQALKWRGLYGYLARFGPLFNVGRFVAYFVELLREHVPSVHGRELGAALAQQLVADSLPSTRAMTREMVAWLQQDAAPATRSAAAASPAGEIQAEIQAESQADMDTGPEEDIYIWNAGLVLASPYLPRLFQRLQLTEASAFKDGQAAQRAVHMLQFLVNEDSAAPEYQLVLNKLLCGVSSGLPMTRDIRLGDDERQQLEGLLQGMIRNWKALGNTSIAGLREAFLQREGRLQLKDQAWHLRVEARPYDMLLDQLPWSYSTIKYPWMERVIHVEWR